MKMRDKRGRFTSRQKVLPHVEGLCDCIEHEPAPLVNGLGREILPKAQPSLLERLEEMLDRSLLIR